MSQVDKAVERLKSCPKDYTFEEAAWLLSRFGFEVDNKGKTSGSRVRFFRARDQKVLLLHKPHPQSIMKEYAVKYIKDYLVDLGEI
ncbi:MAG: type II toxin-antitoxin system HicA family toxin [Clostridia bacterium]|nr:type II toxin-antitoxin system HicA family toxin [Clostridia bacterium]